MKKLLTIFSLFIAVASFSQYDIDEVKKDSSKNKGTGLSFFDIKRRTYVGGELGLSFGQGTTYIHVAPLVGYDITEKFSVGISAMYQLYRVRNISGQVFNFNTYGGGVFARFRPIPQLIMQSEFDLFNTVDFANQTLDRVNVPAAMAGLGYAGGGERTYYQILVMYDFIGDPNMPLPPLIFPRLHLKLGVVWHLN